jgi:hypothetical protein
MTLPAHPPKAAAVAAVSAGIGVVGARATVGQYGATHLR